MVYRLFQTLPTCQSNPNRAIIDLAALTHNFAVLRQRAANLAARPPRPIAVVKADAYGHCAPLCVPALLDAGCDFFAVATLPEAMAVRRICLEHDRTADILILGYTDPREAPLLAQHDLIQTLISLDYAHTLAENAHRNGVCVRVHAGINTGMHRIGLDACSEDDRRATADALIALSQINGLRLEGIFSHFSRADEPHVPDACQYTERQADRFFALCDRLSARGLRLFRHLYNSAASVSRHGTDCDGVRFGVALYGVDPVGDPSLNLRPVMRLQSTVVHLHTLPASDSLGYGGAFSAPSPRLIATLPIGYADGLLRACSGANVLLCPHGQEPVSVPIVGRICMDQCMLDVTDTNVAIGDPVILFGDTPRSLDSLARHAHTIPYELLTSISPRILREDAGNAV